MQQSSTLASVRNHIVLISLLITWSLRFARQINLGFRNCVVSRRNITIHTQERISTDFQIAVSQRWRDVRAKIPFFLRQDVLQAFTCFGSQSIILRCLQHTSFMPNVGMAASSDSKKHGAVDMIDDKSQIFLYICAQQKLVLPR